MPLFSALPIGATDTEDSIALSLSSGELWLPSSISSDSISTIWSMHRKSIVRCMHGLPSSPRRLSNENCDRRAEPCAVRGRRRGETFLGPPEPYQSIHRTYCGADKATISRAFVLGDC